MYDWANEAVSPSWVEGWKDPWKYSFPVSYALWPLFRVSHAKFPFVAVVVRVVDGQATPESTMLFLQAQLGLPGNWGLEDGHGGYGLVAGFQMQRGELKTGRVPIPEWPELAPKKDVEVDKPSGCANCLAVYTVFDEKAKASELEPLLRVDTSCLTRWHYCSDEASIMPAAWAQYDAEHAVQSAQEKRLAACDYPGSFLYQQAENAVLMRVTDEGDRDGGLKFRYEKRLKGPVELQPGAADVVSEAEVGPVRSARAKVGEEMVVLFPGRFSPLAGAGLGVDAYRCGVMNASALGAGVITKLPQIPFGNDK